MTSEVPRKIQTKYLCFCSSFKQVSGYHIGCDFSPDGSIVCSGSADGQAYFYDYHTSRVIRTLQAHSMPCMDVAFHPTLPHCVATCGWSGQVQVWN